VHPTVSRDPGDQVATFPVAVTDRPFPSGPCVWSPSSSTPFAPCWSTVEPAVSVTVSESVTALPPEFRPEKENVHSAFQITTAGALSLAYDV